MKYETCLIVLECPSWKLTNLYFQRWDYSDNYFLYCKFSYLFKGFIAKTPLLVKCEGAPLSGWI